MYSLVSAIAKTANSAGRWEAADIGNMSMASIYTTYRRTIAILSNPFIDHQVAFDLDTVRKQQAGSNQTFNEFLVATDANVLVTSDKLPNTEVRYATYGDAFRSGYSIMPTNGLASADAELPKGAKDWLYMTRSGIDYDVFGQYCLVSVNGFYHQMEANAQGIWVIDGMKTCRIANDNHIGITSFKGVGKLSTMPITDEMIYNHGDKEQLGYRAYIKVDRDLTNVGMIAVIGGYMHALDHHIVYRTGDDSLCINFNNIPLIERYYESVDTIDLSSLNLEKSDQNSSLLAPSQLYSDAAIRAYLKLPQSFLVFIDNTELFVDYEALPPTTLAGQYISDVPPVWPIIDGFGKIANFWSVREDGKYLVAARDTQRPNYVFNTALDYNSLRLVSDSKDTQGRYDIGRLYHQKIGTNF